ncbi:MAG: Fe-S protein assembly co-chaperone HscB, partial [Planctomycetota bacterium]
MDLRERTDHFGVFELPRKLVVDLDRLERKFLRLSREHHPDRFAGQGPEAIAASQRSSARVNDAYRILKDPVKRAEHLLTLAGVERKEGEAKCPPDLLAEVFELRERIMEGPDEELRARVTTLLEEANRRLGELFGAHDEADDP